jgi:DNA-binding transcriptional MerR regulator
MTLAELAEGIGTAPRQIRFLIAEGILPPANKTGRAADAYGEEHLIKAQRYLALHRMGMKPASIKVLMAFDDAVPIVQSGGVELRVSPDIAPEAIDIDAVLADIAAALRTYVSKG